MKPYTLLLGLALILPWSPALADDQHHHTMDPNEKLGSVAFPISCAAEVQKPFERGVALLHSFEYESAEHQFQEVAKQDPKCSMAYWGQAMSLFHGLWARPSAADFKRGHDLAQKGLDLGPKTTREREYLEAAGMLFRESERLDYHERVDAYARATESLAQHNPTDREAQVFFALALLASGPERDPTHANDKKAVAILAKLFDEQPDHPGIAHYIIHACDNPAMASAGLAAARKYAAIAPSSPHAVHMPSHIFARLGLWPEDIASNAAALRAADKMAGMQLHVMHHRMHSMDFMQYAYMQIGDDINAKKMYDDMTKYSRADIEPEYQSYYDDMLTSFTARYAVERRQWKEALALNPNTAAKPGIQMRTYWAHAVAAGHLHDSAAAQEAVQTYDALMEQVKKSKMSYLADGLKNEQEIVHAWALYAEGKADEAVARLRTVADHEDKVGKGEVEIPAREMLADMLLEMNRPKDALSEYELSLSIDPNRFNGLSGAAQAAEKLQLKQKAAGYYVQLLKNCDGVNSDRPELARAKTLLAAR